MKRRTQLLMWSGGFAVAVAAACIIPDKNIVIVVDDCGQEWVASTANAVGKDGLGDDHYIKTADDAWISRAYCVTPAQAADLGDPSSFLYNDIVDDIIAKCKDRAVELQLGMDNCADVATVAYSTTCVNSGGCDEGTGGADDSGTETGGNPDFGGLDLTTEVDLVRGEYIVSQLLIETALADPVGLGNDGTTATQVLDVTGAPYGFEIDGVTSTNLGGVLGLQNGDIVTEVSGQPTETYQDLLDVAAILLSANSASVELTRGTSTVTLYYQRGS